VLLLPLDVKELVPFDVSNVVETGGAALLPLATGGGAVVLLPFDANKVQSNTINTGSVRHGELAGAQLVLMVFNKSAADT
jgi:hypothetical protein